MCFDGINLRSASTIKLKNSETDLSFKAAILDLT